MVFKNLFSFSSEENDPPKGMIFYWNYYLNIFFFNFEQLYFLNILGFERFKRKAKSDNNPSS
jgi:hypothetical protein